MLGLIAIPVSKIVAAYNAVIKIESAFGAPTDNLSWKDVESVVFRIAFDLCTTGSGV